MRDRATPFGMIAAVLLILACGSGPDSPGTSPTGPVAGADPEADPTAGGHPVGTLTRFDETVTVDVGEWFVSPDVRSVSSGQIRFVAHNAGTETHEFVLIEGTDPDGREIVEIEGIAPMARGR